MPLATTVSAEDSPLNDFDCEDKERTLSVKKKSLNLHFGSLLAFKRPASTAQIASVAFYFLWKRKKKKKKHPGRHPLWTHSFHFHPLPPELFSHEEVASDWYNLSVADIVQTPAHIHTRMVMLSQCVSHFRGDLALWSHFPSEERDWMRERERERERERGHLQIMCLVVQMWLMDFHLQLTELHTRLHGCVLYAERKLYA